MSKNELEAKKRRVKRATEIKVLEYSQEILKFCSVRDYGREFVAAALAILLETYLSDLLYKEAVSQLCPKKKEKNDAKSL